MKQIAVTILALCLSAFTTSFAYAGDMRFPEQGNPAFTFHIPDDWSSHIDESGNMILAAADHSSAFSFSVVEYDGSLDDLAGEALNIAKAAPPPRRDVASISGYNGYAYYSTATNDSGVQVDLKMYMLRVDAKHVVTCTRITVPGDTQAQLDAAEAVLSSVAIAN